MIETYPRWHKTLFLLESFFVLLLFFVHAGGPVPGTNESHYLTRTRHFWHPAWCVGDIFLQSPESQPVFQWVFGWPAIWLDMPIHAWLGRVVGWTLLTIAWVRLSRTVISQFGWALLTAGMCLVLWEHAQMAGEWLVGGIEAKIPAYALLFAGLPALAAGRWHTAALWMAAATAFHPLVGGWALVASLTVFTAERISPGSSVTVRHQSTAGTRKAWQQICLGEGTCYVVAGVLILLGIVPAILLDLGADAETIRRSRWIYVLGRLDHHLLLTHFPLVYVVRHTLLARCWWWLWRSVACDQGLQRLQRFVLACVLIAAVGLAIELMTLRNWEYTSQWMRYYWYRMSDSMLPVGFSLLAAKSIFERWRRGRDSGSWGLMAATLVIACSMTFGFVDRQRSRLPDAIRQTERLSPAGAATEYADWRELCDWCRDETPKDALFLTPTYHQTFKWYAHRPEYVIWKDIPQGSVSLVCWWERRQQVKQWGLYPSISPARIGSGGQEILAEAREQEIDFIVLSAEMNRSRWIAKVVFENSSFVILAVP